jgi:hypothetical protein
MRVLLFPEPATAGPGRLTNSRQCGLSDTATFALTEAATILINRVTVRENRKTCFSKE